MTFFTAAIKGRRMNIFFLRYTRYLLTMDVSSFPLQSTKTLQFDENNSM